MPPSSGASWRGARTWCHRARLGRRGGTAWAPAWSAAPDDEAEGYESGRAGPNEASARPRGPDDTVEAVAHGRVWAGLEIDACSAAPDDEAEGSVV